MLNPFSEFLHIQLQSASQDLLQCNQIRHERGIVEVWVIYFFTFSTFENPTQPGPKEQNTQIKVLARMKSYFQFNPNSHSHQFIYMYSAALC